MREQDVVDWAVERWNHEVKNRPLVNIHRRTLDGTWRQVMRHFGGDPDALVGPSHDELLDYTDVVHAALPSHDELMRDYNEPISDAGHVVGDGLVQRIKDLEAQITVKDAALADYLRSAKAWETKCNEAWRERDALREALEHAEHLMFEYGFSSNDLRPVRAALEAKP